MMLCSLVLYCMSVFVSLAPRLSLLVVDPNIYIYIYIYSTRGFDEFLNIGIVLELQKSTLEIWLEAKKVEKSGCSVLFHI